MKRKRFTEEQIRKPAPESRVADMQRRVVTFGHDGDERVWQIRVDEKSRAS